MIVRVHGTASDMCDVLEDMQFTVNRMERRQERIEQMTAMTLALLGYIFLLIV